MKLGELLVKRNLVSEAQLLKGLARHYNSHEKLGECLVLEGFIDEPTMLKALGQQLNIRYFDTIPLEYLTVKSMQTFPESLAVTWCVVAGEENGDLLVFFNDSQNEIARYLEERQMKAGFALAKKSQIRIIVEKFSQQQMKRN